VVEGSVVRLAVNILLLTPCLHTGWRIA
jgi:hypothetical protein